MIVRNGTARAPPGTVRHTSPMARRDRLVAAFLHASSRVPGCRWFVGLHGRAYHRSGGRAVRRWFGAPVLVLEVVGRKTGKVRLTPLIHLRVDGGWVVTAANAGNPTNPQWWRNLVAAGRGVVHLDGRAHPVLPRTVEGDERDRLWRALVEAYPSVGEYRRYTDRAFPVVVLRPTG